MSLYIRNEETDRLARELADRTGETITEAVTNALRERMQRTPERPRDPGFESFWAFVQDLQKRSAARPVLDSRPYDQILYDEDGLPK